MRLPAIAALLVTALLLPLSGCGGPPIDLKKALQVVDVTTGWYDAGIIKSAEGDKNKLVPSISFRLKNATDRNVSSVQINTVFRRVNEAEEWGSSFVRGIGPDGLDPGKTTDALVLRCPLGYTGLQPRAQMLQNREFVDAKVQVFAKHGSANWTLLGEYQIARQLLTQ